MLISTSSAQEALFNSIFFDKNTNKLSYKDKYGIINIIGEDAANALTLQQVTDKGNSTSNNLEIGPYISIDATTGTISTINGSLKPYRNFIGSISQAGDDSIPIIDIANEDNIGDIVFTRNNPGLYRLISSSIIDSDNTRFYYSLSAYSVDTEQVVYYEVFTGYVLFNILDSSGTAVDGFKMNIELRIY
jgi:hypothetical protein